MYWLVIAIIVLVIIRFFLPQIKGWFGEKAVSAILATLPKEEYQIINNVMLKTDVGTSQVDHVVVSIYGIFVIETKNYKGWITGTEYANQWVKNMYGKKYPFRNPIKQNYGHVKALESMLQLPYETFIPIVVFSVNAELNVKTYSPVVYTTRLAKTIRKHEDIKIQREDLDKIVSLILNSNVNSKEMRKQHVQGIQAKLEKEKQSVSLGICPKCGGTLKERSGKRGSFYGCGNYPKCRYTRET